MRILLLLIAGALFAVGCGSTAEPGGVANQGTTEPTEPAGTSSSPTLAPSSQQPVPSGTVSVPQPPPPQSGNPGAVVPADVLEKVLADAATRTGVAKSAVQVTSAQAQSWNDGSLGCREPGMEYIQVLTEGYQIMVSAGGQTLDYRTSDRGSFKVCGAKR